MKTVKVELQFPQKPENVILKCGILFEIPTN